MSLTKEEGATTTKGLEVGITLEGDKVLVKLMKFSLLKAIVGISIEDVLREEAIEEEDL